MHKVERLEVLHTGGDLGSDEDERPMTERFRCTGGSERVREVLVEELVEVAMLRILDDHRQGLISGAYAQDV